MEVEKGTFILLPGSDVASEAGIGLAPSVDDIRNVVKIKNGKLMEKVTLNSPSACGEFIMGSSCNGWLNWKTENGEAINIFRRKVST